MDSRCRPPLLVLRGWQCCPCRGVDLPWWGEGAGQIKSGLAHRAVQACPWCSAQMVTTHTSKYIHTHSAASWDGRCGVRTQPLLRALSLQSLYTLHLQFLHTHTEQHVRTHTTLHHTTCSPQRSNQPSPPPHSFWVFLHHLILAVCMWIIHHSLNQSIEFHLVRCYTGHVIDSLVPFHWSLNDTQCWFVDARAHAHTSLAYTVLHWVSIARGGELGAHAAKEDPFEIYSRSPCPAGCANICSAWPQDWHERGLSTLLDLGSTTTFGKITVTAVAASWRCIKSKRGKHENSFFFFLISDCIEAKVWWFGMTDLGKKLHIRARSINCPDLYISWY